MWHFNVLVSLRFILPLNHLKIFWICSNSSWFVLIRNSNAFKRLNFSAWFRIYQLKNIVIQSNANQCNKKSDNVDFYDFQWISLLNKINQRNCSFFQVRALHSSGLCLSSNPKLTPTDEVVLDAQPNVEVCDSPPEWKYVEQILPKPTVPVPTPKKEYTSGWTPQSPEALKQPYFIKRSRNHMVPVYLNLSFRGTRKQTIVRNIKGDIWKCNEELMDYIEYYMAKKERSHVNEFTQQIRINGDYVNLIKDYLASKGF